MVVWKFKLNVMVTVTGLGGIHSYCAHVMPAPPLSPLASVISPSKTIEIHALTKEMEARGEVCGNGACKECDRLSLQLPHVE